jgi:hypothetical protein
MPSIISQLKSIPFTNAILRFLSVTIRNRIRKFVGLPDVTPNPDPSINKQKKWKNLEFYSYGTSEFHVIFEDVNVKWVII